MTAYRQSGHEAACSACGAGIDRDRAYFDLQGDVVCRACHSRGSVHEANRALRRWKGAQSPAAYAGAVLVTMLLVGVGYVGRCSSAQTGEHGAPSHDRE